MPRRNRLAGLTACVGKLGPVKPGPTGDGSDLSIIE